MTVTLKVATTSPHSVPGRAGVLQHLLREAVLDVGSLSRVEQRRGRWVEQEQPAIPSRGKRLADQGQGWRGNRQRHEGNDGKPAAGHGAKVGRD